MSLIICLLYTHVTYSYHVYIFLFLYIKAYVILHHHRHRHHPWSFGPSSIIISILPSNTSIHPSIHPSISSISCFSSQIQLVLLSFISSKDLVKLLFQVEFWIGVASIVVPWCADFPTGEFFVQAVKWNQWEQCKKKPRVYKRFDPCNCVGYPYVFF